MRGSQKDKTQDYFLIIPVSVARKWFNPAVLYGEILSISRSGPCVASDAFFAERFGVSLRTVRYALKSLEEAGLIERKRAGSAGREIIVKGEPVTGKNLPNIRQEIAAHAEKSCRPDGNNLPVMRQNLAKTAGKILPNSNNSLVINSLSKQALPTDQEIFEYADQIGLDGDAAERFIRQMESDAWQINGDPVRNWKALLRSRLRWQNQKEEGGKPENGPKPKQLFGIHL